MRSAKGARAPHPSGGRWAPHKCDTFHTSAGSIFAIAGTSEPRRRLTARSWRSSSSRPRSANGSSRRSPVSHRARHGSRRQARGHNAPRRSCGVGERDPELPLEESQRRLLELPRKWLAEASGCVSRARYESSSAIAEGPGYRPRRIPIAPALVLHDGRRSDRVAVAVRPERVTAERDRPIRTRRRQARARLAAGPPPPFRTALRSSPPARRARRRAPRNQRARRAPARRPY